LFFNLLFYQFFLPPAGLVLSRRLVFLSAVLFFSVVLGGHLLAGLSWSTGGFVWHFFFYTLPADGPFVPVVALLENPLFAPPIVSSQFLVCPPNPSFPKGQFFSPSPPLDVWSHLLCPCHFGVSFSGRSVGSSCFLFYGFPPVSLSRSFLFPFVWYRFESTQLVPSFPLFIREIL